MGRFGAETILFVKPDDALELCRIAHQLGVDLKTLEPLKPERQGDKVGKKVGYKHKVTGTQTCFYCHNAYPVKIKKEKVWRHCCLDKMCRRKYAKDRHAMKLANSFEESRRIIAGNLKEMTGFRVTIDKKKKR